jgi:RND family efflux transporter MFP subunit
MPLLQKRGMLVALVLIVVGAPATWLLARDPAAGASAVVARVKRGEFLVTVTTSGELRARKFVQITVPPNVQEADIYQMKIASIVPEGTVVKVGDLVAELDRSSLAPKMAEVSLALQKAEAVYEQAMLDSTLNLSKAREDIRSMELGLEEKRLAREQASFEAPTVRRQAEIDLEKAERALAQARLDYKTKTDQAQAKMREVGADLDRQKYKLGVVQEVMRAFTITAPAPGMVIYVKEWNGRKRTTGSQVNSWDPGVATLPDLTQMESVTYVNEIDIRKVQVGQKVVMTLDSDPTKRFTGTITSVANVGEQRPNTDAKVFEVKVNVTEVDTTLRPGMTTGNNIETLRLQDVLSVPLEALNGREGVPFVYKVTGGSTVRQEIVTGAMSEDEAVITQGLTEDDRVLLAPPADGDRLTLVRLPGSTAGTPAAGGDTARSAQPYTPPADTARPPGRPPAKS